MGKISNALSGIKILEEVNSEINGKLVVQKDLAWGVHIIGGGLTQSGGVAETVWHTSLKQVKHKKPPVKSCLILGLGGGSIAKIVREFWPKVIIDGVEIDPLMLELGQKHMDLGDWDVNIFQQDARQFVRQALSQKKKYDLICVDIYVQQEVPSDFSTEEFVQKVYALMSSGGIAVFNRLYFNEKRKQAEAFRRILEKVFDNVDTVYPEANVMYLTRKS